MFEPTLNVSEWVGFITYGNYVYVVALVCIVLVALVLLTRPVN